MSKKVEIDTFDRKILNILMQAANTSHVDIAKRIYVSPGTVHLRVKKLLRLGIIKNASLDVDYTKLGYDVCAFLGIYLERNSMYTGVIEALDLVPEIVNMHYTVGMYNIFAQVICRNSEHFKQVLCNKIHNIEGVRRVEVFISLEESIRRPLQILEEEDL